MILGITERELIIQEIKDYLTRNFANFAVLSTTVNTNPYIIHI